MEMESQLLSLLQPCLFSPLDSMLIPFGFSFVLVLALLNLNKPLHLIPHLLNWKNFLGVIIWKVERGDLKKVGVLEKRELTHQVGVLDVLCEHYWVICQVSLTCVD